MTAFQLPQQIKDQRRAGPRSRRQALRALGTGLAALWVGAGTLAAPGAGSPGSPPVAAVAAVAPAPLPGAQLRLSLSPNRALVYEPGRLSAVNPLSAVDGVATRPSFGLEFRSPAAHQRPSSLLRLQLSADAALQFRPRRGGLAVSYRAQF